MRQRPLLRRRRRRRRRKGTARRSSPRPLPPPPPPRHRLRPRSQPSCLLGRVVPSTRALEVAAASIRKGIFFVLLSSLEISANAQVGFGKLSVSRYQVADILCLLIPPRPGSITPVTATKSVSAEVKGAEKQSPDPPRWASTVSTPLASGRRRSAPRRQPRQ